MRSELKNISIDKYTIADKSEWDDFVSNSNNGTIFHRQMFLDYHEAGKFDFTHYIISCNGKIAAVLPGAYKENNSIYWSPVGASYGSLVTGDISFELALNILDALLLFFKNKNISELYLIPPPLIYNLKFNQHIEYAMLYRNFGFEYHYISHAVELSNRINFRKNYQTRTRSKINKILKNPDFKILEEKNYKEFYPILLKNKLKHATTPTHSLRDLQTLEDLMPDKLKLFIAYYKNKPVGGHLLFLSNKNVSLCFYNAMDYDYDFLDTGYALVDHAIEWSIKNNYNWYDIGVSQDTLSENPMTPSLPLIYFKEKFGARGIFRSTFCYKFS